jgi:hypothetical protein
MGVSPSVFCDISTMYCRVQANKRISCHWLLNDPDLSGNLRVLLEHGVQVAFDKEEVWNDNIKVSIGYTRAIGISLWSKIKSDRAKVGVWLCFVIVDIANQPLSLTGWRRV